jgi:hypothetical protein
MTGNGFHRRTAPTSAKRTLKLYDLLQIPRHREDLLSQVCRMLATRPGRSCHHCRNAIAGLSKKIGALGKIDMIVVDLQVFQASSNR